MKVDFNKIKTDISLPDFLLKLGWKFAPGTSHSRPKMTDGAQTIIIKKNAASQYTYWDVHSDHIRGKSIIDLMQNHILQETGKIPSLREIGEILQGYIDKKEIVLADNSKYSLSDTKLNEDDLYCLFRQLKPYNGDYLSKRGISKKTLESPVFSNTFFTYTFRKQSVVYNNVCTKMISNQGFQGISQRNDSFKGIIGSKFDSVSVSNYDKTKPIDQVYVGESMIDCASHYQLKNLDNKKNILYISTEGTLAEGQMKLIKMLLEVQSMPELVTIFDNDKNGYKYTINLHSHIKGEEPVEIPPEELEKQAKSIQGVDFSTEKDWNEDLQKNLVVEKKNEFITAAIKGDFVKISQLKDQGFSPTIAIMKDLEASGISLPTLIGIQKLFSIVPNENIKMSAESSFRGQDPVAIRDTGLSF